MPLKQVAAGTLKTAKVLGQTETGKKLGANAVKQANTFLRKQLGPALDTLVKKNPKLLEQWASVTAAAATKGTISGKVLNAPGVQKVFGTQGAKLMAKFSESLLRTATTKGFGDAFKFASRAAPNLLKGASKILPGVGLVLSLYNASKVFADPTTNAAQRTAALIEVAGGVAGALLPGAALAIGAATSINSAQVDAEAKGAGWTPKTA